MMFLNGTLNSSEYIGSLPLLIQMILTQSVGCLKEIRNSILSSETLCLHQFQASRLQIGALAPMTILGLSSLLDPYILQVVSLENQNAMMDLLQMRCCDLQAPSAIKNVSVYSCKYTHLSKSPCVPFVSILSQI